MHQIILICQIIYNSRFSSDRVLKMLNRLKDFYETETEQKFCCIIFVKRRYTANVLYHLIKVIYQVPCKIECLIKFEFTLYHSDISSWTQ